MVASKYHTSKIISDYYETIFLPPVTGEFTTQKPVTRSFDVFFDLRLNKRWSKQLEAGYLRRHRAHPDVTVMNILQ